MKVKAPAVLSLMDKPDISPIAKAYFEFNHLKHLYRQGWLRRSVPLELCESVAEHTFCMAILGMFLCDAYFPSLDVCKVLRLILLHEVGEIYAGDIIPADGVAEDEKHRLEAESTRRVLEGLPEGKAYLDLWFEFEAGQSPEARFVRQLDRLEMGFQVSAYQHLGLSGLDEFYSSVRQALVDPEFVALFEELETIKPQNG